MKKYMDKFKSNIYINKNLFIFLLVIVIIGIASGTIFSIILGANDKELVGNYLNNFFSNLDKLNYEVSITNSLIFTILFVIIIWFLGLSVVGFFLVLFLLFLKSFILGFSVGSIIINLKLKGVIISFIYVFPHQVINIFIFILISAYALIVSFKIIRGLMKKRVVDFRNILNRYLIILTFSIFILIFTSLYEVYIMPFLLNLII
ncbi:MAG: stage II sporulation protein M [Bacilli bacterium]|nr:stage II sporulation protein M [Bacilli bacterium]